MSQKTGTKAERENADRLIAEGHTILFFSTTSPCDLLDMCCHTLVEVKTTKFKMKKLSGRERDQLSRLLEMKDHMPIRYDIKFIRFDGLHSLWQSFFPIKMVSSFRPEGNNIRRSKACKETVLKSNGNKKEV